MTRTVCMLDGALRSSGGAAFFPLCGAPKRMKVAFDIRLRKHASSWIVGTMTVIVDAQPILTDAQDTESSQVSAYLSNAEQKHGHCREQQLLEKFRTVWFNKFDEWSYMFIHKWIEPLVQTLTYMHTYIDVASERACLHSSDMTEVAHGSEALKPPPPAADRVGSTPSG